MNQKLQNHIMNDINYLACIDDLISHDIIESMKSYLQHGETSVYEHSLHVSYICYQFAIRYGLNHVASARAGLLHDFFLYDYHTECPIEGVHGIVHPQIALRNAQKYFEVSELESEIILKHMWPRTRALPRTKESSLIVLIDKYCAIREYTAFAYHASKRRVLQFRRA